MAFNRARKAEMVSCHNIFKLRIIISSCERRQIPDANPYKPLDHPKTGVVVVALT